MANTSYTLMRSCLCLLIFYLLITDTHSHEENSYELKSNYDLCDHKMLILNPALVYMGHVNDSTEVFVDWPLKKGGSHYNCLIMFKSCSTCRIHVEPVGQFSYPTCQSRDLSHTFDGTCAKGCAYFHLFDADYKKQTSLIMSKWHEVNNYASESKQLHILACGNEFNSSNVNIRLRLTVEKKEENVTFYRQSPPFEFASPVFPDSYILNNEEYTYNFKGLRGASITILFDDWMIFPDSSFKFYNANIIGQISGKHTRPYIKSTSLPMSVVFSTGPIRNMGLKLGFSAVATYYAAQDFVPSIKIDCDRIITSHGGVVHMGRDTADGQLRDCIWLMKKPTNFERVRISISRFHFQSDGSEEVEIRDGLDSKGLRKLYATGAVLNGGQGMQSSYESEVGFYIRLKGRFIDSDSLVIVYSSYFYGCSPYISMFVCSNKRCIADSLKCDGNDHCGDNSDESHGLCGTGRDVVQSSPTSHAVSAGIIVPIVVSVVLVIVMCLVIIFVRRCRRLSHETYGNGQSAREGGHSRGRHHRRRGRNIQMSVTVSSGEHPPSYHEAMQNSPIGQFNMAFTWSGLDSALPQPPSYQEAIGAAASDPPDNSMLGDNAHLNDTGPGEVNERAIDVGDLESLQLDDSLLNSLLDIYSHDDTSSSSSEGVSERLIDSSSSSDSSLDNEHSFASEIRGNESERTVQNEPPKDEVTLVKEDGKDSSEVEDQVEVLSSPNSAVKFKSKRGHEISDDMNEEDGRRDNLHRDQGEREAERRNNNRNEPGLMINSNQRNSHVSNEGLHVSSVEGETYGCDHHENERAGSSLNTMPDRGTMRHQSLDILDEMHRRDEMRPKEPSGVHQRDKDNWQQMSNDQGGRDERHQTRSYAGPDNWRSQSLVDLSHGAGRALSILPSHESDFPEMDKRFSYAGAGDMTFRNERRDPYALGSLTRDDRVENLHRFTPSQGSLEGHGSTSNIPSGRIQPRMKRNELYSPRNTQDDYRGNDYKAESRCFELNIQPGSWTDGSKAVRHSSLHTLSENALEEEDRTHHPTQSRNSRNQRWNHDNSCSRPSRYKSYEDIPSSSQRYSVVPEDHHLEEPNYYNRQVLSDQPKAEYQQNHSHNWRQGGDGHLGFDSGLRSAQRNNLLPVDNRYRDERSYLPGYRESDNVNQTPPYNKQERQPSSGVHSSRQKDHARTPLYEPSATHSNHDKRPKPTPRRSIMSSRGSLHDQSFPSPANEFPSNGTPLSVTNYVASGEDGQIEAISGDGANAYPLAQLVFKATDDDVYV